MRKIIVIGGSNSVIKDGWTNELLSIAGEKYDVVNRAIGASETCMGIFRLKTFKDINPGDIVIWEYAVNDNARAISAIKTRALVRNVKWFTQICSDNRLYLVPLIIPLQSAAKTMVRSTYINSIQEFFSNNNIDYIDGFEAVKSRIHAGDSLSGIYRDRRHFSSQNSIISDVAKSVFHLCEELALKGAQNIVKVPEFAGRSIYVITDFQGSDAHTLKNSIFEGTYYNFCSMLSVRVHGNILGIIVKRTIFGATLLMKTKNMQIKGLCKKSNRTAAVKHKEAKWQIGNLMFEKSFYRKKLSVNGMLTLTEKGKIGSTLNSAEQPGIIAMVVETDPKSLSFSLKSQLLKARNLYRRLRRRFSASRV